MKNYYNVLGVNETSSQDEIKKAYRKLSKQYHPDVNPDGEEKFKDISEAYDILGDEGKKNNYDNQKNNPFGGFDSSAFDIHSMFEDIEGNRRRPKAPDKTYELHISPIESYFGAEKDIVLNNHNMCNGCNGNGGKRSTCGFCNGMGATIQIMGTGMFKQQFKTTCTGCNGHGSVIVDACKTCKGVGTNIEEIRINVKIPANVDNGDFLKLKNKGDFYHKIGYGDVILKVNCTPTDNFEKIGYDLIYNKTITPLDMMLEDKIEVKHPDGDLVLTMPEKINTNKPLRILNKGYKTDRGIGNFYIKITIEKTKNLDLDVKNKLKEILKQTENIF
jgi:molecular chaperone DnaJ